MMPPDNVEGDEKEHAHSSTVLGASKARSRLVPRFFLKQDLYLAVHFDSENEKSYAARVFLFASTVSGRLSRRSANGTEVGNHGEQYCFFEAHRSVRKRVTDTVSGECVLCGISPVHRSQDRQGRRT